MSRVIERWIAENEKEHGHYAVFVGFINEIKKQEDLCEAYDEMDIYEQIALMSFVFDLLKEEAQEKEIH